MIDRVRECLRLLQIHRQTLERRFAADDAVDASLSNLECELIVLLSDIKEQ